MKKITLLLLSSVLLALCIALASCGSASSETTETTVEQSKSETSSAETTPIESQKESSSALSESSQPEDSRVASYSFNPITAFCQERAWVRIIENTGSSSTSTYDLMSTGTAGRGTYGVIDELGNLIYTVICLESITVHPFNEDGYSYYSLDNDQVIIDKDGNEHWRATSNEDTQYEICGQGDSLFLVLESKTTFSDTGTVLYAIAPNGEEVTPRQNADEYLDSYTSFGPFRYYGKNIFRSLTSPGWSVVFNSQTGNLFNVLHSFTILSEFTEDTAPCYIGAYVEDSIVECTHVPISALASSEAYNSWESSLSLADNEALYSTWDIYPDNPWDRYIDSGEWSFFNHPIPVVPEGVHVDDYSDFSGDYASILLRGTDGKQYVTMIDNNGDMVFEPVKLPVQLDFNLGYGIVEERTVDEPEGMDVFYAKGIAIYKGDSTALTILDSSGIQRQYDPKTSNLYIFDGDSMYFEDMIVGISNNKELSQVLLTDETKGDTSFA